MPVTKKYYPNGVAHPAVFSNALMLVFDWALRQYHSPVPLRILDPFAGTGRVHELQEFSGVWETVGIEIEPEWAELHPRTIVGNALDLPFHDNTFDAIVTSPTYGNRMADHHVARDASLRRSYTHDLGRKLHWDNSGQMHWGREYREFHEAAWYEAVRVLTPRGLFILNCKDHIRGGERQHVCRFHLNTLRKLGLKRLQSIPVKTPSMRAGENRDLRLQEFVYVLSRNA